jgi:hypothetical protein
MTNELQELIFNNEDCPVLTSPGDEMVSLFELVADFKDGEIRKPSHQRDKVWDQDKKDDWIERIKSKKLGAPIGVIVTYQLDNGKPSPVWLNDGYQRISATLEYLADPARYYDSKNVAIKIIKATRIPKQHRHYKNHDDALKDFQNINKGTSLTPYEYYHGILAYMSNHDEIWGDFITSIHKSIQKYEQSFVKTRGGRRTTRETQHVYFRDNYALFYRLATDEKRLSNYTVGERKIKRQDQNSIIEYKLRSFLEKTNPDNAQKILNKLNILIKNETSLIRDVWVNKLKEDINTSPNNSLYRWLLHCAVWKKNNSIPNHIWEDFLEKTLYYSDGTTSFPQVIDGKKTTRGTAASTGSLAYLRKIAAIVESDILEYYDNPPRRKKPKKNLPGTDESHQMPFVYHGEGETIPEPASRNRARGKNPIK